MPLCSQWAPHLNACEIKHPQLMFRLLAMNVEDLEELLDSMEDCETGKCSLGECYTIPPRSAWRTTQCRIHEAIARKRPSAQIEKTTARVRPGAAYHEPSTSVTTTTTTTRHQPAAQVEQTVRTQRQVPVEQRTHVQRTVVTERSAPAVPVVPVELVPVQPVWVVEERPWYIGPGPYSWYEMEDDDGWY